MRYSYIKKDFPAGNPIANVLVIIAGALVIGISIVLGFVALVALSAVVLVSAAVIGIRVWWLNRKLRTRAAETAAASGSQAQGAPDVIEGEYRVVSDDSDKA